jgi:hypothetical protein
MIPGTPILFQCRKKLQRPNTLFPWRSLEAEETSQTSFHEIISGAPINLLNRVPIFSKNINVKSPSEKKMRMSNSTTINKDTINKKVKKSMLMYKQ